VCIELRLCDVKKAKLGKPRTFNYRPLELRRNKPSDTYMEQGPTPIE
ncbi:32645_t:CDS:1, partial [Gigaspora margarita]